MHIAIAGRRLAIHGEWSLPADKKEAQAFLKTHRARLIVDDQIIGERVLGAFDPASPGEYAGALLAGKVVANGLIFQALENGQVWFAAVRDGMPLADYDRVTGPDEANRLMADVLSFNPRSQVIGDHPAASRSLESVIAEADKRMLAATRVAKPGAWLIRLLGLAGAGALALALAAGGWAYWQQWPLFAPANRAGSDASRRQADELRRQAAEYRQTVAASVVRQREDFRQAVAGSEAVRVARRELDRAPLRRQGWSVRQVICTFEREASCARRWGKGSDALQTAMLEIPEIALGVQHVDSTEVAATPVPAEAARMRLPILGTGGVLAIAGLRDRYARHGATLALVKPPIDAVATHLPAAPAGVPPVAPPRLGGVMQFVLEGDHTPVMAMLRKLDRIGIGVTRIQYTGISPDAATSVRVDGRVLLDVEGEAHGPV